MCHYPNGPSDFGPTSERPRKSAWGWIAAAIVFGRATAAAGALNAQQLQASPAALVFDGVTVIDVEQGTRIPAQRVVIAGNRIATVGASDKVVVPAGAQVVDAKGKYLIPGLWDVHTHISRAASDIIYPLFIANGVTGIRDAGTSFSLDTLRQWRKEIWAGTRVGPPRQFLSGQSLAGPPPVAEGPGEPCERSRLAESPQTCVSDKADAIHVVDSLKAAGADMVKLRSINSEELYYGIIAEARRLGLLYGGHIQWGMPVTPMAAADSGVTFLDHVNASGGMDSSCIVTDFNHGKGLFRAPATIESCRPVAEALARKNTWHVPTLAIDVDIKRVSGKRAEAVLARLHEYAQTYEDGSVKPSSEAENWLRGPVNRDTIGLPPADSIGLMRIAQKVGLPMVAGTDALSLPGFALHAELIALVVEGVNPLVALQAATLNPAKALRLTDSLGTVTPGKLADLVLLDADPLGDITNTTMIRAVVANGRYFDRAALNRLLVEAQAEQESTP